MEAAPEQTSSSRRPRALPLIALAVLAVLAGLALLFFAGPLSGDGQVVRAASHRPPPEPPAQPPPRRRPQIVKAVAPGEGSSGDAEAQAETDAETEHSAPSSDAQVKEDIRNLRGAMRTGGARRGARAGVDGRGDAVVPLSAPKVVAQVIDAGNRIARKPYVYGGGHGAWRSKGYDCSGSISFALAGAGLLDRPLDSSSFMRWGSAGRGRWITVYANPGHAFMVVAGLRFDTSGANGGTRWQESVRGGGGYTARHPTGL